MAQTVLDAISLGYQLIWNAARRPVAARLFVGTEPEHVMDARHLLSALRELWPGRALPLLLSIQSPLLLRDALAQGGKDDPWIEVPIRWLSNPAATDQLAQASARGLQLVGQGLPEAGWPLQPLSHILLPQDGQQDLPLDMPAQGPSHLYMAPDTQAATAALLAHDDTWGIVGWPIMAVLEGYQNRGVPPDRQAILKVLALIATDASMETIEQHICDDPILAYRFLLHLNAPETGLRQPVQAIHPGLLLIGYTALQKWLEQELPLASDDIDLQPVRRMMVMRAQLMEKLIDAGEEENLRREIYLCGLLAHLDALLGKPMADLLETLPFSERIHSAWLRRTGPYARGMLIADALASPATHATRDLCLEFGEEMEEVNRALLRTLVALPTEPADGR